MKDLEIRTNVVLNTEEMNRVYEYYKINSTVDYLKDTYPDWSDDMVQDVAIEANELMDDEHLSEEDAVQEAIDICYDDRFSCNK